MSRLHSAILARLPDREQVTACYAVIVFVTFSWTFLIFIWKLSSWVNYLATGDIVGIAAYAAANDLLSSLVLLGLLLLSAAALPPSALRNHFSSRGTAAVIAFMCLLLTFDVVYQYVDPSPHDMAIWTGFSASVALLFTYLAGRLPSVSRAFASLADRMVVFLYLWVPVGAIGVLIVVFRLLHYVDGS